MKNFLGIFYGAMIFSSYFLIKILTGDQFAHYFVMSSGLLTLGLIPFTGFSIPKPFGGILIRGFLYSTTNFLLLTAQSKGEVSSSLVASLMGVLLVSIPRLIHPIRMKNIFILSSLLIGALLLREKIQVSSLALIAGIIQALTFETASKIMRVHQHPIAWNLIAGFASVFFTGLLVLPVIKAPLWYPDLEWRIIIQVASILLLSQISFFTLYRWHSTEAASRYSLGRIPWSYFIEFIFVGKTFELQTTIGALFLAISAFMKKERRSMNR